MKPLDKNIIAEIEQHFDHYWYNNPLGAFRTLTDLRFIRELPDGTVAQIFLDFLFIDFLYKYNTYLKGDYQFV